MLDTAVSHPWLLRYTRCDLTFLCPALARLTSFHFRKACLCCDLQCLCVWYGLAKKGGCAQLGVIDRVTSICVSEIGG
jgi:hypothetical protein